jgi:hypothetical protein
VRTRGRSTKLWSIFLRCLLYEVSRKVTTATSPRRM